MADGFRLRSDDELQEISDIIQGYAKDKPPKKGTGTPPSPPPSTDQTTVIKIGEDIPGVEVMKKREGGEELYKPTTDSWLTKDTGQDFDFMDEFEIKKIAQKAWEGSEAQQRQRAIHEKHNPSAATEAAPTTEEDSYSPSKFVGMDKVKELVDDPELLSLLQSIAKKQGHPNKIENYTLGSFGIKVE